MLFYRPRPSWVTRHAGNHDMRPMEVPAQLQLADGAAYVVHWGGLSHDGTISIDNPDHTVSDVLGVEVDGLRHIGH